MLYTVDLTLLESFTSITIDSLTFNIWKASISSTSTSQDTPISILTKSNIVQNEEILYYSQHILEFSSDYVTKDVIDRLTEIKKQALFDFVKTSVDINEYGTMQEIIFE